MGILAMSRAIGDLFLKPYVSAVPDVKARQTPRRGTALAHQPRARLERELGQSSDTARSTSVAPHGRRAREGAAARGERRVCRPRVGRALRRLRQRAGGAYRARCRRPAGVRDTPEASRHRPRVRRTPSLTSSPPSPPTPSAARRLAPHEERPRRRLARQHHRHRRRLARLPAAPNRRPLPRGARHRHRRAASRRRRRRSCRRHRRHARRERLCLRRLHRSCLNRLRCRRCRRRRCFRPVLGDGAGGSPLRRVVRTPGPDVALAADVRRVARGVRSRRGLLRGGPGRCRRSRRCGGASGGRWRRRGARSSRGGGGPRRRGR